VCLSPLRLFFSGQFVNPVDLEGREHEWRVNQRTLKRETVGEKEELPKTKQAYRGTAGDTVQEREREREREGVGERGYSTLAPT
jgi:hypothetical protein